MKTRIKTTMRSSRGRELCALLWMMLCLMLCAKSPAAPFARQVQFTQPDGTSIRLWGRGDEFHAVFETLNGFTVVFVPESRAYFYARLSDDGTVLESTGAMVGRDDPGGLGLVPHLRIAPEAARALALQKFQAWDKATRLSERWATLKAQTLSPGPRPLVPPTFQTTGVKCGLTVLVDFEDERATISREEVWHFINGDSYTGFGNNGSVKQYYWDVSNGALTFTNVVTPYITIPNSVHPRSYYNDPTKDCFQQCSLLIRDALNVMKSLPNFTNDFLPLFQSVTVDSTTNVVSANFFVAGNDSGVWLKGIWAQSSSLSSWVGAQALWPGGKIVDRYQLSPMYGELQLNAFCHENGHMLCGYPDLYDYGYDSWGGAGSFCLMGYCPSLTNPCQFCAYLKLASGWATPIDLLPGTNFTASLSAAGTNFNRFLRLRKPGTSTEYFLVENRQQSAHDASLPGAGLAIWHIDELGSRDNQSLNTNSTHANYEATLVQADNHWDFEYLVNFGDVEDLFYAGNPTPGYANAFSDLTSPSANWWNGTRSGLELSGFSSNAQTMTCTARVLTPRITVDPRDLTVFEGQTASFGFSLADTTQVASIQWLYNGAPLEPAPRLSGTDTNPLVISAAQLTDAGRYAAVVTHDYGTETSRVARLTVCALPPVLSTNLGGGGSTTLLPDGLDLSSSGLRIGSTSDSFRYAYQPVSGDFDVIVRIVGINMATASSRAGLMVREQLASNSRHVSVVMGLTSAGLPCSVLMRTTVGGTTQEPLGFSAKGDLGAWGDPDCASKWLRLKREGNRFTVFGKFCDTHWVFLKSVYLDLSANAYVGMAVAAGSGASSPATASFRDYQLQTSTPTALAVFTLNPAAQEGTLDAAQMAVFASRNGPLTANVRFGGTATSGRDYLPLASQVSIPADTNIGILTLTAMNDALAEWPETVEVSVANNAGLEVVIPACAKALILDREPTAGGLRRRIYSSIGGTAVADLTRQMTNLNAVTDVGYVTSFEAPTNGGSYYGQVLEGWLIPPETGNYVFYLASADCSELWLGTNSNPAGARRIAAVRGYTQFRQYSGSGNQSGSIPLQAGQYYYVKALHKKWVELSGVGCFSVAWQTPSGPAPTNGAPPIDGSFLAFSPPLTNGLHLAPPAAAFSALAATGSVQVTSTGLWSAQSLDNWITLLDNANGTGDGVITYALAGNRSGILRAGTIVINGLTHSVIQEAAPALRWAIAAGGVLQLVVDNVSPLTVVIEASDDLLTWNPIWTNTAPASFSLRDIDPLAATRSARFYRAAVRP